MEGNSKFVFISFEDTRFELAHALLNKKGGKFKKKKLTIGRALHLTRHKAIATYVKRAAKLIVDTV